MPGALRLCALVVAVLLAPSVRAEWKLALPGWTYEFPRDHGNHPDFKTEWWYFTGNLSSADGREFGYQLTFFRQGIGDGSDVIPLSRFVTRDIKFAHFAVSDISEGRFFFDQALSRGAFGEAGFDQGTRLAWLDQWSCERTADGAFHLKARTGATAIDLTMTTAKPPVIHGTDGISQKATGEGRASHYYSLTRLETTGTVSIGDQALAVTGLSWFDHEWATNQLGAEQAGWDWFSLQFNDGSELMLFQLRLVKGGRDEHSGGTYVASDGHTVSIGLNDFTLEPLKTWDSGETKATYPIEWKVIIPKLDLTFVVQAAQPDQELRLKPMSYWEGSVHAQGAKAGQPLTARGYLEMTGYAGRIVGLQAPEQSP